MKRKNSLLISLLTAAIITSQTAYADAAPETLLEEGNDYSVSLPVAPETEEDLGLNKEPDTVTWEDLTPAEPITPEEETPPTQDNTIPWEELVPAEDIKPQKPVDDIFNIKPGDATETLPKYVGEKPDGYTFVGWNTDKDAEEGFYICKKPSSNIVLYGIWKKDTPDTIPPINISEDTPAAIPLL